jgi:hypothetical protein
MVDIVLRQNRLDDASNMTGSVATQTLSLARSSHRLCARRAGVADPARIFNENMALQGYRQLCGCYSPIIPLVDYW